MAVALIGVNVWTVRRDKRKRSLSICQVAVVERWSWRFDRILVGVGSHSSCNIEPVEMVVTRMDTPKSGIRSETGTE